MSFWSHMRIIGSSWKAETKRRKSLSGTRKRGSETAFLPEALEIVETPPSPIGRTIMWAILLFCVLAVAWSVWGRIDIVATAPGQVVAKGQSRVVEAREMGVVTKINVRNGDSVKAGDVLVELDETISSADTGAVENELRQAGVRAALAEGILSYLKNGSRKLSLPEDLPADLADVSRRQLQSRILAFEQEERTLLDEVGRAEAARESAKREISRIEDTLPLIRGRYESYKRLADEGLAPKIEAMRLQEELLTREKDLDITRGRFAETLKSLEGASSRQRLLRTQLRRDALAELGEAEAIKADRTEAKRKANLRDTWQIIRAPVDGVIMTSTVTTIGEVVEPGNPIMMIAPADDKLIVRASILNKDIGFVKVGDPVSIKLEAFPFTRYGLVEGTLTMIAADAEIDERMGPIFPAEVELKTSWLGEGEFKRELQLGMNATAEIKTGDRPIYDFILSPIAKRTQEAARER